MKINIFHPSIPEQAIEPVTEVLKSKWIGQGEHIKGFEKEFMYKFGTYHPAAVISGTAALHLAVILSGIKKGDEVITTPLTCPATNYAILYQGGKPIFCDIQYSTGNIDPEDVKRKITERTKAIMCVDYGGRPCDLYELKKLAVKHQIPLIEDAAQSLGSTYEDEPIGRIADYTCFSFQALKIITTIEGGMLCVKNKQKYQEAVRRRWYAVDRDAPKDPFLGNFSYPANEIGYKYNMNNIAALIGREQIKVFDGLFARKQEMAQKYREAFEGLKGVELFRKEKDRTNTYYAFPIHIKEREKFVAQMGVKGIQLSVGHTRNDVLPIFGGKELYLPNLKEFMESIVWLPIHNKLTNEEVNYIIQCVRGFLK